MSHGPDYNRTNLNLRSYSIKEVLPQYYAAAYPNLITFLEGYYDYIDSDGTIDALQDLYSLYDLESTDLKYIEQIFASIADGANSTYFGEPREVLRNFANFYRVKGTKYSAEGFFRAFYGLDVEIEYPKNNLFIVSESQIGTESLRFIQDGALYQIFSVLIKSSIPLSTWRELYKKFVHPAGFYFEGQVTTDTEAAFALSAPLSIVDSDPGPTILSQASVPLARSFTQLTALIDSSGGGDVRSNLDEKISDYQSYSLTQLDTTYHKVSQIITPNAFTFDDTGTKDSDLAASPDFSVTLETMDNQIFTRYTSDSTI